MFNEFFGAYGIKFVSIEDQHGKIRATCFCQCKVQLFMEFLLSSLMADRFI